MTLSHNDTHNDNCACARMYIKLILILETTPIICKILNTIKSFFINVVP